MQRFEKLYQEQVCMSRERLADFVTLIRLTGRKLGADPRPRDHDDDPRPIEYYIFDGKVYQISPRYVDGVFYWDYFAFCQELRDEASDMHEVFKPVPEFHLGKR